MEQLVLLLPHIQSSRIFLVVDQLLRNFILFIRGSHGLIFDNYAVQFALFDQFVVLIVLDFAFRTSLKLFPGLLLDHGSVRIHVLPIQSDLLELFRQSGVLLGLVALLFVDLFVGFNELLLSYLLLAPLHL